MKKIFFCFATAILMLSQANAQSIKQFVEGRKIVKVSKSEASIQMEMMGQNIEQIMSNSTTTETKVTAATDKEIKMEQKITKMKMSMSAMGQEMGFDSEKPNENEQMNKAGDIINKVTLLTADGNGIVTDVTYSEDMKEIMKGVSAFAGLAKGQPVDFIMLLPTNAAIGKTWKQSFGADSSITEYNYTINTIENGVAKLNFTGTVTQHIKGQTQGMDMATNLSGKVSGSVLVDVKTNLVKSRTTKLEMKGSIDMMGQSAPMETTTTTEDTYQ